MYTVVRIGYNKEHDSHLSWSPAETGHQYSLYVMVIENQHISVTSLT